MPPADAHSLRRREDVAKLEALQAEFRDSVTVVARSGDPISSIELLVRVPTAVDETFPLRRSDASRLKIDLPGRYPFEPPKVTVVTRVWNPNIFSSGLICLGQKWLPTENLALLVQRVMRILALEPSIINLDSPANREAASWYSRARAGQPSLFPTVNLDKLRSAPAPTIGWRVIR